MPRKTKSLILRDGDYEYLRSLIKQRTIQAQVVIQAHILLDESVSEAKTLVCQQVDFWSNV